MASYKSQNLPSTTVLVTGGSGFVGSHLILQLLSTGYTVRTTIRTLVRESDVRKWLADAGAISLDRLTFYAADLLKDDGWAEAVKGCSFVHHVASPFPSELPKNENDIIRPARDGALRVLRASRDSGVKRVILTSSFAAIGYGHPPRKEPFMEKDWSNLESKTGLNSYQRSKTVAEKAAWEFMEKEGGDLELTVLNPVGIFGPIISRDFSSSIQVVQKLMDGSVPRCPQLHFGVVDVRDLSDLHIRAMLSPEAKGERFIAINDQGSVSFLDIAKIIKAKRPQNAKKVPTRELPNLLVHALAIFSSGARSMIPQLGSIKESTNKKATTVLGWKTRSLEDTIIDTVDSLIKFNVV